MLSPRETYHKLHFLFADVQSPFKVVRAISFPACWTLLVYTDSFQYKCYCSDRERIGSYDDIDDAHGGSELEELETGRRKEKGHQWQSTRKAQQSRVVT